VSAPNLSGCPCVGRDVDELGAWLDAGYARSFRTAWLMLRNRDDAQEVVQEAYLRVWRFRHAIPDGDGRDAWLYRVVVNATLSRLRADKRWRGRDDDRNLEAIPTADTDGPARRAEQSELAGSVLAALAALPESLRIPVVLRYYAGLSEKEIAVAISRRPGTVKSRLHEARARLSADSSLAAWATETDAGQEVSL
jgi:RNA polymerase sigma-70 factor (ECF subfamily)